MYRVRDVVKIRKNGERFFVKIIKIHNDGTITTLAKNDCVLQPIHFNDKIVIHEFDIIELYGE
jgi:hypothetical protein